MKKTVRFLHRHTASWLKLVATLITLLSSGLASAASLSLVEAIRHTLEKNPNVQIQEKQLESSQGVFQQTTGQFDTTVNLAGGYTVDHTPLNQLTRNSYASQRLDIPESQAASTTYSVALNKTLRNGLVLSPSISTIRNTGTTNDLSQLAAQNRAKVSFNILLPLNQGRRESAALSETAAKLAWDASKQDLRVSVAQAIVNTVSAYWKWVAGRHFLDIAREAEASMVQMVRETQKLIDAQEIPAADLLLVRASLMDKTSARLGAEQAMLEARQKLGQATGMAPQQLAELEPLDDFPSLQQGLLASADVQQRLLDLAMQQRADLAAARLRQEAAKVSQAVARSALQPQLDLNLSVGYATLLEGNAASSLVRTLNQNRSSANIGTSISYQWPVENNVAKGRYVQQSAAYDQATTQLHTLEQSISLGVEAAWHAVIRSAQQAQESEASAALYQVTARNEKTKSQLGNSTLIDVLSVNDRLLGARQNQLSYHLNYLNALVQLRFETGALLRDDASASSIRFETFVSPPTLD
ncbi:hypothetical protein MIZ03_0401 [Rhodoferax lithotrophicus]|uniref:Outer membrane efflux protein n=1 Tax=Rhodoferax lithotrophicus TaxID=2798804 RepID=A0ABM7MH59_9BURK|nr:TolC family protein [Rhodoferax sp. MIZ03]BCO25540.1 hypothetical protein MIZ03_0401 [Rhodoferax sp. MIZ03]